MYSVEVPTKQNSRILLKRELEDSNWPVIEVDLKLFFQDWPKLAPAYQAKIGEISEWSEEKLTGIERFLLIGEAVNMPRLQSANLVSFPWWDLRRYSRQRFTTVKFVNGRHRMSWMYANGVLRVPVQIRAEYAGTIIRSYKGRVLWPAPICESQ